METTVHGSLSRLKNESETVRLLIYLPSSSVQDRKELDLAMGQNTTIRCLELMWGSDRDQILSDSYGSGLSSLFQRLVAFHDCHEQFPYPQDEVRFWHDISTNISLTSMNIFAPNPEPFAAAIAANQHLTFLNVSVLPGSEYDWRPFCGALQRNKTLEDLIIEGDLGHTALSMLAMSIRQHTALRFVRLRDSAASKEMQLWEDVVEANPRLCEFFFDEDSGNSCKLEELQLCNYKWCLNRTETLRNALIAFLGIRKRHRFQSGLFQDSPRDILKMIAQYAWGNRLQTFGGPPKSQKQMKHP